METYVRALHRKDWHYCDCSQQSWWQDCRNRRNWSLELSETESEAVRGAVDGTTALAWPSTSPSPDRPESRPRARCLHWTTRCHLTVCWLGLSLVDRWRMRGWEAKKAKHLGSHCGHSSGHTIVLNFQYLALQTYHVMNRWQVFGHCLRYKSVCYWNCSNWSQTKEVLAARPECLAFCALSYEESAFG